MLAREQRAAPREDPGVELLQAADARHRHHQVAPEEAHRVLDGALLVAGGRVAVGARAAVVSPQGREQRALRHLPPAPAAQLGCVVEHQADGGPAHLLEQLAECPAGVLRAVSARQHLESGVAVGERQRQGVQGLGDPGNHGLALPVVDLRGARRPPRLQEPVALPPVLLAPPPDEALHGGQGPGVALFVAQPLPHAPGGVALLARGGAVRLQPRPRDLRVPLHRGLRPLGGGRGRRGEVLLGQVPGDRVAAHPEPAGDLPGREAPGVHLADARLHRNRHRHPSFPFRWTAGSPSSGTYQAAHFR